MDIRPLMPGYRIGEVIARGSTATVWAATPADTDRELAVKVVPVAHGDDEERLALELSALAVARAADDHLVTVVDVVALTDPAPAVAIVMERLRQGTLTCLVATRGHLTPGEVVTILTPVALTAAMLHDGAVVHGDLSPSNVGFDSRGRPVVLDLGVSAVIGTPREEIYGTPGFVAPEVVAGEPPSPHSDVYAIAALGWFALTGEPPPIPAERPALDSIVPEVPSAMQEAFERALHPDPALRGDGRALATAIYASAPAAPVQPGEGSDEATMLTHRLRQRARAAAHLEGPGGSPTRTRRGRHAELRSRSRSAHLRIVTTFVAAVVIGAVGVAAAAAGRGLDPPPVAPASSSVAPPLAEPTGVGPGADYTLLLQSLVQARAAAWADGDPAVLDACFTPGSAALANDTTLLARAAEAGHRYDGVEFSVAEVRVRVETEDRLMLEASIETSPYAVHTNGAGGASVVTRDATRSRVELTVVLTEAGWRISEVGDVIA